VKEADPVVVKKQQDLIQNEETDTDKVSWRDYWNFFKHSGGVCSFILFFISTIVPGVL
jgi:hypothetical protein